MKAKWRRLLACMAVACMMLGLFPMAALAADGAGMAVDGETIEISWPDGYEGELEAPEGVTMSVKNNVVTIGQEGIMPFVDQLPSKAPGPEQEKMDFIVRKIWNDPDHVLGGDVQMMLMQNGKRYEPDNGDMNPKTLVYGQSEVAVSWSGLDVYDPEGNRYEYYVIEVPAGFDWRTDSLDEYAGSAADFEGRSDTMNARIGTFEGNPVEYSEVRAYPAEAIWAVDEGGDEAYELSWNYGELGPDVCFYMPKGDVAPRWEASGEDASGRSEQMDGVLAFDSLDAAEAYMAGGDPDEYSVSTYDSIPYKEVPVVLESLVQTVVNSGPAVSDDVEYRLPDTGGIGTAAFYAAGMAMLALAGAAYVMGRRRADG